MHRVIFLLALWSGLAYGAPRRLAFDWDDNVVGMPTKVHLIHKVTGHRRADIQPHSLILRAPEAVREHYEMVSFASLCGAFSGE